MRSVPALLSLAALAICACGRQTDPTFAGTVEATDAQLGFAAAGRIEVIGPHEGDRVTAGQVLARLDTAEAGARLQQAFAQEQAAGALLLELERGTRAEDIEIARANFAGATNALADAKRELERYRDLADRQVVSRLQYDKLQTAYDLAKSRYDQTKAQLDLAERGPRAERIAAQRAQVATARAQVKALEALLDNMVIRAPFDGIVTVRHREPGEAVSAGAPVLTLMNPGDRWVRVYVPEPRLGTVHLGEQADIRTDARDSPVYQGQVSWVSDQAEFTPRNVQTAEERVKLVYAVKVRITGDTALALKPGVPANVALRASSP